MGRQAKLNRDYLPREEIPQKDLDADMTSLLAFKKCRFSQNGEDGVIAEIFRRIGTATRSCCEVGAHDGVTNSNTRALLLNGWKGLMIESDPVKFDALSRTYSEMRNVQCTLAYVDNTTTTLSSLVSGIRLSQLDFLSIDIDGRDYEVFSTLAIRPRVISVEANAGHFCRSENQVAPELAAHDIGQPLSLFHAAGLTMGYDLVAYTGNAFFVLSSELREGLISPVTPTQAYCDFVHHLTPSEREWLFVVNKGLVPPFHYFRNPDLRRRRLTIQRHRASGLLLRTCWAYRTELFKRHVATPVLARLGINPKQFRQLFRGSRR